MISSPWFEPSLAALGLVLGLLWAASPWIAPRARRLVNRGSRVSGDVVLFELMQPAKHPESYANSEPNAIQKAITYGSAFDLGLHIENRGKPTRLRRWSFRVEADGHVDTSPSVEPSAWPPPQRWHRDFPGAITLSAAEAMYFTPGQVYIVYCRLRIKSPDYRTFPQADALVVSATDGFGRVATFRMRGAQDAFQNSASIPNS